MHCGPAFAIWDHSLTTYAQLSGNILRILHIMGSVDPADGGPIEGVLRGASVLNEMGHSREIVCLDPIGSPVAAACEIRAHAVGPNVDRERWQREYLSFGRYRYAPKLTAWLRAHVSKYDAVIVNGLWNYSSMAAWRTLRRSNTPYFVFTHGMLDPWFARAYPLKTLLKRIWWRLWEHRVLRDAACVFYTTEEERLLAHQAFQPYKCREQVVGYGTAPPPERSERAVYDFRVSLPGLNDRPYLLFLSRIDRKKGCDVLIEAFARIAAMHPSLQLIMAGPDQTGWRTELEALAEQKGLADRIYWPGMVTGERKWAAFYGSLAFVLASHSENFGIVVAEALACAKPVLITDKVNIWREVEGDGAGLVSADAAGPFADILARFLALGEAEQTQMGERARKCFTTRFHIEAATRSLVSAIDKHRYGAKGGALSMNSPGHYAQ